MVLTNDVRGLTKILSRRRSSAIINYAFDDGYTCLHLAAFYGYFEIAKLLINAGANVHALAVQNRQPLHRAATNGHCEVVKLLIEAGSDVNAKISSDSTPLHHAMTNNLYDVAKLLIDSGADIEATASGCTPLNWAVDMNRIDLVKLLIDSGANVNACRSLAMPPMFSAVRNCCLDVAQLLAEAGAEIDPTNNGWHYFSTVVSNDSLEFTYFLIKLGFSITITDGLHVTLLHVAAMHGSCKVAEFLIKAGINVNCVDDKGNSPLHLASQYCRTEIVKLLIDAGANVTGLNSHGNSPCELLLSSNSMNDSKNCFDKMFTLLTDAGAIVDGATATISPLVPSDVIRAIVPEDTPFWLAANNDAPMLAAELAGGLDPNMKTENGMTLLHWACAGDAPECVQLLLDAGADKEAGATFHHNFEEEEINRLFQGFLVRHNDDMDNTSDSTPTPIFYCMHESADCLKHLIKAQANANHRLNRDYSTFNPINYALAADSPACVTALVEAGATRKQMRFLMGQTPLRSALQLRPVPFDATQALLAGDDGAMIDGLGLYWAVENSTVDGVRVLVEAGADVNELYESRGFMFDNVLQYAVYCLTLHCKASNRSRLTAIVDYLKSLSDFNEEK